MASAAAAKNAATRITRTSTCLCRKISFTASGIDRGVVLCHCSNCQKASGSAFMHNLRITDSKVEVHKGQDLIKEYHDGDTLSKNTLIRRFCGNCGSPLWLENPKVAPDLTIVHLGTAGDKTGPFRELFGENRHEWLTITGLAKPKI